MTATAIDEPVPICPDCAAGKHRWCNGKAWDFVADEIVDCQCGCDRWTATDNRRRSPLRRGWTT